MKGIHYILGLILLIGFLGSISSCTYENEEEYYTCDTINVSYNNLTYIFTNNCSLCHFPNNPYRPGIVLSSYEDVEAAVRTGRLVGAINHRKDFIPMPFGSPKLSDCDLSKIQAWIDKGMPEN